MYYYTHIYRLQLIIIDYNFYKNKRLLLYFFKSLLRVNL